MYKGLPKFSQKSRLIRLKIAGHFAGNRAFKQFREGVLVTLTLASAVMFNAAAVRSMNTMQQFLSVPVEFFRVSSGFQWQSGYDFLRYNAMVAMATSCDIKF